MDYLNVMQTGVLGNLAYDLLKLGVSFTFDNLSKGLKAKGQQWLLDEQATDKIADRVSELYHDEQSLEQFNQTLAKDSELVELLTNANQTSIQSNRNTQTVSDSPQSTIIGGSVNNLTIHQTVPATEAPSSAKDTSLKKR